MHALIGMIECEPIQLDMIYREALNNTGNQESRTQVVCVCHPTMFDAWACVVNTTQADRSDNDNYTNQVTCLCHDK